MRNPDIIILGGGIIGCALAEELARHGRRVIILERTSAGAEASSAAAGILSSQLDVDQPGPFFDLCQAARKMYPRWIEHVERRTGISVGYHVDGVLYLAMSGQEDHRMDRRRRWQTKAGLRVERWSRSDVRRREPAVDGRIKRGYFFPTEPQIDNVRLMEALAAACRKAGVELQEGVTVRRLLTKDRRVRGVELAEGQLLDAPTVVNCLGSWAALDGMLPGSSVIEPARGQLLEFDAPKRLFRHVVMADCAYAVQRRDGRLLVGSTVEFVGFNKRVTLEGMTGILTGLHRITTADTLRQCTFRTAWAGLRPCSRDRLPILGQTRVEGLIMATGHFRHGILLAPITAKLLAEQIVRGQNPTELAAFNLERFEQHHAP